MKTQAQSHKIPDGLTAAVFADGKPVQGLLIMISLEMTRRNAFSMVFGPSNKEGKIEISKGEIECEVARTQNMFPMDYDDLSSFKGEIIVAAMSLGQVESALNAYDLYHNSADYPSGYREKLTTAQTTLRRLTANRLDVEVTLKPRTSKTCIIPQSAIIQTGGSGLAKRSG